MPEPTPKTADTGQVTRVLIVEDEAPLAHALVLKLQHDGFQTAVAGNGLEALDAMQKQKFDVVLCDLIMPQADGFTLLEELRARKDTTSVIVLSNLGQAEDRERALAMGAKDYFVKSNTPISDIVKAIRKFA